MNEFEKWAKENQDQIIKYDGEKLLIHPQQGIIVHAFLDEIFDSLVRTVDKSLLSESKIFQNGNFVEKETSDSLLEKIKKLKEENAKIDSSLKEEFLASLPLSDFEIDSGNGALRPKSHIRQLLGYSK